MGIQKNDIVPESIRFLRSEEGEKLLQEYQGVLEDALPDLALRLYKKKIPYAAEIITMLKLRKKGEKKFMKAANMFFTSEGLEQACSENISRYIARRFTEKFPPQAKVVDLTVGLGGNAIFLAEHLHVQAVDLNPTHLLFAKWNAEAYGVEKNMRFIEGRAEENLLFADAFFIDPQRIREGKTKTRSLKNSSPDILAILPRLLERTRGGCLKISPAFDYAEINLLPTACEMEIISEQKTNKAALLWFGTLKTCERRATILLKNGEIKTFTNIAETPEPSIAHQPLQYIF